MSRIEPRYEVRDTEGVVRYVLASGVSLDEGRLFLEFVDEKGGVVALFNRHSVQWVAQRGRMVDFRGGAG